jgi:hypothetical protein
VALAEVGHSNDQAVQHAPGRNCGAARRHRAPCDSRLVGIGPWFVLVVFTGTVRR